MTPTSPDPNRRVRAGKGRFVRTADTAERDADACRLRTAGMTYDQIATQLGFMDRSVARRAVDRALAATVAEPAAHLRTLELARLDAALVKAFAVLNRRHVVTQLGKLVIDPETGEPLEDSGPTLAAIDRIIKIGERRCKLLGLDAPVRVEAVTVDRVEAEINRLALELGLNDQHRIEP